MFPRPPVLLSSPFTVIVPPVCHRPSALSLCSYTVTVPTVLSSSPCSVIVPLLCHRTPALSLFSLFCHRHPAMLSTLCSVTYPCTVLVPPALSSSPYAVIVVLGLSLLPMLCRRPPFPSSSPLLSVHLFRHVPLLRQNCCPKRQPPSAPQLSSLHNDDFLLLRIPADTRTHSSALGSGQAKR